MPCFPKRRKSPSSFTKNRTAGNGDRFHLRVPPCLGVRMVQKFSLPDHPAESNPLSPIAHAFQVIVLGKEPKIAGSSKPARPST